MSSEKKEKPNSKEIFGLKEVLRYYFRKKDPNQKPNVNLKMMHGVNKISMIMFLLGVIYMVTKHLIF